MQSNEYQFEEAERGRREQREGELGVRRVLVEHQQVVRAERHRRARAVERVPAHSGGRDVRHVVV